MLLVQISLFNVNALLLSQRDIQTLDPFENVAMRDSQVLSALLLDQIVEDSSIFGMRVVEGELFNGELSLEKVHWVFKVGVANSVHGHSKRVILVGLLQDVVVELVNYLVHFGAQHFYFLFVRVSKLVFAISEHLL